MIFITEGDSATGSIVSSRDVMKQFLAYGENPKICLAKSEQKFIKTQSSTIL